MEMAESPDNVPTILDYLNEDCWRAVLYYVPVRDIMRTESTSRRWQEVVLTYLRSVRILIKDSPTGMVNISIQHRHVSLLMLWRKADLTSFESWTNKLGGSVVSAHCSSNTSLRLIRKNCPNLEDITFHNLDDVIDEGGFKCLRQICFRSCYIPVDYCIRRLMCTDTLEKLEIIYCRRFTGQCLVSTQWTNLKTLILHGYLQELQSRHLLAATCLGQLTTFELRYAKNKKVYKEIHLLVDKMPNLERLCVEGGRRSMTSEIFFESVGRLRHLKALRTDLDEGVILQLDL